MARPTKQGIDYFPLDCRFDDETEMLLIETGANGLAVLVCLWQMIYSNKGYYITHNKDLELLIKRKIDLDINLVSDIINLCLSRNLFNKSLHKTYSILTSKGVQKRYFDASKNKKIVEFNVNYIINGVNVGINGVNVGGNATNVKEEVKVNVKEKEFDLFWDLYPRKIGKQKARAWWMKKDRPDSDKIISGLKKYLPIFKNQDVKFIPHPTTWLNGERWEDELDGNNSADDDQFAGAI